MNEIPELMNRLSKKNCFNGTYEQGVSIYKSTENHERQPLLYKQGIIFVGQGSKRVYLSSKEYLYSSNNYLVLATSLPVECEAYATEEEPFLALFLEINMPMISQIISDMNEESDCLFSDPVGQPKSLLLASATIDINDTLLRLLRVLNSSVESRILASGLVKELLFRVIQGEGGAIIRDLVFNNTNLAKINRVLKIIHEDFCKPINIDNLANIANMSTSSFHRAFKDVTTTTPIQYLKKIRLNNAKNLIIEKNIRVNQAARLVGYESTNQFSREFKKYFGCSPKNARNIFLPPSAT
ncbi:MAG: AraC family transcriptional regulator [Colwellia sp.]|nr:AraC family transcriptional regulator [Colwellia sp.]